MWNLFRVRDSVVQAETGLLVAATRRWSFRAIRDLQRSVYDTVGVVLRSTGFAEVLVGSHLAIAESDAWTMLPDFTDLALDHDPFMV